MLRNLRNSIVGQVFLGGIVVAIIITFAFTGIQATESDSSDDCAVTVGKKCVSPKEFQAAYLLLTSIGLNDSAAKRLRLREQVGRGLAEREVLLDEAARLGLGTSQDDIDAELLEGRTRLSLPADSAERLAVSLALCVDGPTGCAPGTIGLRAISVKQDGKFDLELYKRTVRVVTGRSPNHFKEMQQREYTAERLRNLIRSQVRVSPEEAFLAYSRARSKATGRTVKADTKWFARYVTSPTAEEVDAWIEKNKTTVEAATKEATEKWQPGCAVVSEIRLDNADPNADEAKETKKKADELLAKIKAGASFDAIAREASESDSASLGGRLGCLDLSYGAGAGTLVDAAKELGKKDAVSPVVETIRGFHILKLVDYVTDANEADLVREYVGYKLASEALAAQAAEKFAKDLISAASDGKSLEEATANLLAETLKNTPFSADDSLAKKDEAAPKMEVSRSVTIEQNPVDGIVGPQTSGVLLFDLAKADDVHQAPIATQSGFVVLQLKEKDMITREKFEEERAEIMMSLQKRKADQALSEYVSVLIKQAGGVTLNPKYIPPAEEDGKEKDS